VENGETDTASKAMIPSKSNPLDESDAENDVKIEDGVSNHSVLPDEIENEIEDDRSSALKPPSILKILGFSTLVAGLLISVLLNISFLSAGGEVDGTTSLFQWIVVSGALLITTVSLATSFWLYYVRSIYLKDGPALVPEKWGVLLAELGHVTNQSNISIVEKLTSLIEVTSYQSNKSEALLESFLTLQEAISNRDDEIARLKKGHDAKIFKQFITRFIRVSSALEEIRHEAQGSDQEKNLKWLCRLIQNALEECGVEQISPEIGDDYRKLGSEVDDTPKIIDTKDELKDFHIASVESPAYIFRGEGDLEVIIPATVTIYRREDEEGVTTND
jgi:hypothetical protein